jgi:superfamily II DNA or RNA helicase
MRRARPYQLDCASAILRAFGSGKQGVVVELFTGAGKGYIIAAIAKMAIEAKGRVLIAVNRNNLCNQLHASVREQGLFPVMERGMDKASALSDCVVGSIETMQGRRLKKWKPDHFSLVITDECHGAAAETFTTLLNYFKSAKHLGLSATIERHDKAGLWSGYEECVYSMPLTEGINQGWLVPFQFEELPVPIVIDDKDAKKKMWTEADESGVFAKDDYLPRLFKEASDRSHGKKGLSFWPNCKSSEEAAKEFCGHGIESRHVDGYMKKPDIEDTLEWFKTPGPKCLMNADLLSYGYDNPSIDLIGIMRLSRSIPMLKQRLGRGTRPTAPVDNYDTAELRREAIANSEKSYCHVLDLMLQLGEVENTFATPSALITTDKEEREFVEKEMRKGKMTMAELESKLKANKSQLAMDRDTALAKLAEDAANAALKASRKEIYIGHILTRFPHNGKDASPGAMCYLRSLGFKQQINLSAQQCYRITELYKAKQGVTA